MKHVDLAGVVGQLDHPPDVREELLAEDRGATGVDWLWPVSSDWKMPPWKTMTFIPSGTRLAMKRDEKFTRPVLEGHLYCSKSCQLMIGPRSSLIQPRLPPSTSRPTSTATYQTNGSRRRVVRAAYSR
jgi:hypothetical protein